MKKILAVLLALSLLLVGCSSNTNNTSNSDASNEASTEGTKTYKIGIIQFMDHVSLDSAREGFIEEMANITDAEIEYVVINQNADMSLSSVSPQKMVDEEVDLILAIATPSAQGAKNIISDIPIVFTAVTDPVGAELVDSIEEPGANVTGVSDYIDPATQIDDFLVLYPDVETFGVIYNTAEQNSIAQIEELQKVIDEKGLKLQTVGVSTVNDIPQAVVSIANKVDALFALTDNVVASAAPVITENLLNYNLPSLSAEEGQVKNGLLMSSGVTYEGLGKQAARMALRILEGADVSTMPVEYKEETLKLVNKTTAEALGLDLNSEVFEGAEFVE